MYWRQTPVLDDFELFCFQKGKACVKFEQKHWCPSTTTLTYTCKSNPYMENGKQLINISSNFYERADIIYSMKNEVTFYIYKIEHRQENRLIDTNTCFTRIRNWVWSIKPTFEKLCLVAHLYHSNTGKFEKGWSLEFTVS